MNMVRMTLKEAFSQLHKFVGSFLRRVPSWPERTLLCEHFWGQKDGEEEVKEMSGLAMNGERDEGMDKEQRTKGR